MRAEKHSRPSTETAGKKEREAESSSGMLPSRSFKSSSPKERDKRQKKRDFSINQSEALSREPGTLGVKRFLLRFSETAQG